MQYESIKVARCSPSIGAEIGNIDLTHPLSNREVQELHTALLENLVIFFRDQSIDFESFKRLGRYFGELHYSVAGDGAPSRQLKEEPEIRQLHFDENSNEVSGEVWHTDQSCAPIPPLGSILHLHTVPPDGGGDTMFASMYAAYDALSPRMKAYCEGLTAVHDGRRAYETTANNKLPVSTHPLVVRHQETGRKLLYFTGLVVTKINELPLGEGDNLIRFLTEHCAHPDFQMRFRWRPNSIAFWDNRCAHHRAIWDYFPHVRSGYRIQIKGTAAPVAA